MYGFGEEVSNAGTCGTDTQGTTQMHIEVQTNRGLEESKRGDFIGAW